MPNAALTGTSMSTGHGCFPPQVSTGVGSPTVMINGAPAVLLGDLFSVHCCETCHPGTVITGSTTVYINGRPVARVGDLVGCGSGNVITFPASPNVMIGG